MKIVPVETLLLSALLVGRCLALAPVSSSSSSSSTVLGQSSRSAPMEIYDGYDILTYQGIAAKTTVAKNPLQQLSEGYSRLTSDYYLPMAFLQSGFLASSADVATQLMQASTTGSTADGIDGGHVAAMAMVASTMSGAMNAVWLKQLEQAFPGTSTKAVATKTLIHAVILASIINSAYLVGVPLFTNMFADNNLAIHSLRDIFGGWKMSEFITLTKLEVMMFIPYNTLAFKFVPPSIRPLTHASISATFNVAVSAITLGIFGTWCDYAVHIFSSSLN